MTFTHSRRIKRLAAVALAASLSLILLGLLSLTFAGSFSNTPNHADVVVDLGNGRTLFRRVAFTETNISGLEALQRTGLNLEVANFGFGSAVCSIEGVGCPATNCFCDPNRFWGYYFWDGAWQFYSVGAGSSTLTDGAVEGWAWGNNATPAAVSRPFLAAQAALQWMAPQQQANGSYGNNVGATLDVLLSVRAGNLDPQLWRSDAGASLVDFLRSAGPAFANGSAAGAGKLAVGVAAAGLDPHAFGALNLVTKINSYYDSATGAFGANTQDQAWSILGLVAAGEDVPAAAVQRLASLANADGGWSWAAGVDSDVDSTALVVQALIAAGQPASAPAVVQGLAYLRGVQLTNSDGGFAASPTQPWGTRSNTNSTAFAVQGVLAAGQDPLSAAWTVSATTPISFLLGQQLPEGGFAYVDPPADLFATQQVVPALMGKSFPYASQAVAQRSSLAWVAGQQQADGSFAGFNPGATVDAVLGIVAAGDSPQQFVSGSGQTPLDYLATQADSYSSAGASAAGKLMAGVAAAGEDPRSFGGVDLVARLLAAYDPVTGKYGGGSTWDQAWALIGLVAAGEPVPAKAVEYLTSIQATGGGWGFTAGAGTADVDSTSLALQALAAAGVDRSDAAVADGFAFLRSTQQPDAGFPGFLGTTDAGSTGLALAALAAFGENPRSPAWTVTTSTGAGSALTVHNAIDTLLALQSPEGGFPGFSGANDPFATYQALPGLSGRSLPLRPDLLYYFPLVLKR